MFDPSRTASSFASPAHVDIRMTLAAEGMQNSATATLEEALS